MLYTTLTTSKARMGVVLAQRNSCFTEKDEREVGVLHSQQQVRHQVDYDIHLLLCLRGKSNLRTQYFGEHCFCRPRCDRGLRLLVVNSSAWPDSWHQRSSISGQFLLPTDKGLLLLLDPCPIQTALRHECNLAIRQSLAVHEKFGFSTRNFFLPSNRSVLAMSFCLQ